jgi:hypothetical protein
MAVADIVIGAEAIAGDVLRTPPSAVLSAPAGVVTTTSTSATWAFTSSIGRTQAGYRVKLRNADASVTFADSGIVLSASTTYPITYLLSSGSAYVVAVTVFDGLDWSAEASTTFTVDIGNVNSYPDQQAVGSVYEVAINGVGYMMQDHPDASVVRDRRYRRNTLPLTAPRFATGSTPFSESLDHYTFVGYSDFTLGSGQRLLNRAKSVDNAFLDSENVDPFTQGTLSLLPTSADMGSGSAGPLYMCVASDTLFVVTGANTIKAHTTLGGAATTFTVAAAGTITDMTSDGTNWYVTDGVGIFRGATAVDPGAAWSTIVTNRIKWSTDRLVVAVIGTGSTPNVVQSVTPAGVVETIFKTFAAGTTVRSITSGNGYVWFAADQFDKSGVWAYQLGTPAGSTFSAFELPAGQTAMKVGFYQSNVFVRARELAATGNRAVIYRCIASTGNLISARLVDFNNGSLDHSGGDFAGDDRFVAFSWRAMSKAGNTGFAVVDLSAGGYAKWLSSTTAGAPVALLNWKGRWVYSVTGEGVLYETLTPAVTGWLRTSISDLASQLTKVLDSVRLSVDALPSNSSVQVKYTLDGGNTYTSAGILSTAGAKTTTYTVASTSDSFGLEVTLNTTGTTPVVKAVIIQLHALGMTDQILIVPINCSDRVGGLNDRPIPEQNSPGSGAARARLIEQLTGTRIKFQDVDWPVTKQSSIFEVIEVLVESVNIYDRQLARQGQALFASLTLRRNFR